MVDCCYLPATPPMKAEESLMALGSMMASRYIAPFKESVSAWVVKLSTVSDVLEQWIQVQAMWLYLEAVFTSGDIAKQLPQESKRNHAHQSRANHAPITQ